MRFNCENLGFHFEMGDENYVQLSDNGKMQLLGMSEQQSKQTFYAFAEAKNKIFTGKYFTMTLDGGRYPTDEAVEEGFNLCIENVKKYTQAELVSETSIMPGNIRRCIWKMQNGLLLSQYYMSKNTYMFCTAGVISKEYDDLDNLMASVCMSVREETKEDLAREAQQELMTAITAEANRLVDEEGLSIQDALDRALDKFGVNKK